MIFRDFLTHRTASHDAKGDFVRLALADPTFPDAADWPEMRAYFIQRHKNEGLAEAGEHVLREFKALQRKLGRGTKA